MKKHKQILISFVGSNDAGNPVEKKDGAILTALKNQKFNEVILLWNRSHNQYTDYGTITNKVKSEIIKRKLAQKVSIAELPIEDVTDHNQIYILLKKFTDTLEKSDAIDYTAAISSGTPAMQVCWILLAESGDFSERHTLNLIKTTDPKFGKSENIKVKIDTTLPKIIRLKEENEELKKNLIPSAQISVEKGTVTIGTVLMNFSPIEFCYYRYFAEMVKHNKEGERFDGLFTSLEFMNKIYAYHEESFPHLDLNRHELALMIKAKKELSITTFRGNVSKANKKLKNSSLSITIKDYFSIAIDGRRGAKYYRLAADAEKIEFL